MFYVFMTNKSGVSDYLEYKQRQMLPPVVDLALPDKM